MSSLVFQDFGSCGDLVWVGGFNFIFESDASDDFSEIVEGAELTPVLFSALAKLEYHVQHPIALQTAL